MKTPILPGGGKAWFVRSGPWWHCQVTPVSAAGWILISFYVLAAFAISAFLFGRDGEATLSDWIVWAVLITVSTFLFLVVTVRMAAPAPGGRTGRRRCS